MDETSPREDPAAHDSVVARDMQLRLALEVGGMGDWIWDRASDEVTLSPIGREVFGIDRREGLTWRELQRHIVFGDAQNAAAAVEESVRTGRDYAATYRVRHPDRGMVWVSARGRPVRSPAGVCTGLVGVVRDITAERLAEEELKQRTQYLEVLNRTGAAVAAELDLDRIVQQVTDAGVELSGAQFGAFFYSVTGADGAQLTLYTLSGADRSSFDNFGHPRPTPVFAPTFEGSAIVRSDDITRDPRYGHFGPHHGMPRGHLPVRSYLAVPVASRSGEVLGGLFFGHSEAGVFSDEAEGLIRGLAGQAAVAVDNARLFEAVQRANESLEQRVEERTRDLAAAHEALRQAQKMEAIGQLTGGIAHDFNNLLTVIRGSADVLKRDGLPEERRRRYLDAISETADRAAKLTGQLLAFARRQALKPELFDAAQQVRGIADMLHTVLGSRIRLIIEAECADCYAMADIAQFDTALVNMAVNARDAMDGEGELRIAIGRASDDSDAAIAIKVSDTGHGIPPELIDRIFEPFFTTKDIGKGTGLGLSQVYGFAKQSDGELTVASEPGKGTVFTLTLPAVQHDAFAEVPAGRSAAEPDSDGHVLIVEDNVEVGQFALQLLGDLGFRTTFAATGQEALGKLEEAGGSFDVVFSDVVMPGIGGVEFARLVRQRWPALPVVLTSGYSEVLAGEANHGFPLLHKPYSVDDLSRILREARQAH